MAEERENGTEVARELDIRYDMFRNKLKAYPLVLKSMSRKENCWDNAVARFFFFF